jgi:hypothetical protein
MFYSPLKNTFYAPEFRAAYVAAGTWPDDAVEVSDEIYQAMQMRPPEKIIVSGQDGLPMLSDLPPPTPNQIIIQQIATLEASITQRRQREAILGIDNGWLADVNAQIIALRAKLK